MNTLNLKPPSHNKKTTKPSYAKKKNLIQKSKPFSLHK